LASLALLPAPRLDAHRSCNGRAGDIAVAFFVLGAPIALLVGALTDSFNRRNLFVAVIALGEGPCLATAYVKTYPQLFAMRALTGISIGGSLPLLYSLLGDLVPPARRSAVSAGVGIAQGAGIALGQILAGYLGSQYGWRRVRCGCARAWWARHDEHQSTRLLLRSPFASLPPAAHAGCRSWWWRCLRSSLRWRCCCAWRSRGAARRRLRSSWTGSARRSMRSASSGARCSTSSPSAPTCWHSRRACPAACRGAS
jgi:MFS family permease